MAITMEMTNLPQLAKELEKLNKDSETVIKRTMSDIRSRGPGWVADGIVQKYAIKKGEITSGAVGSVKVTGDGMENLQITYRGRVLTPVHFNMSPKAPKPNRGGYSIKMTVLKGQRKTVGQVKKITKKQWKNIGRNFAKKGTRNSPKSPWMLSTTGAKSVGKVGSIPFQRREQPGELQYVLRTVSLPQMVRQGKNGPLHPPVAEKLNDNIEKRFNHHVSQMMK